MTLTATAISRAMATLKTLDSTVRPRWWSPRTGRCTWPTLETYGSGPFDGTGPLLVCLGSASISAIITRLGCCLTSCLLLTGSLASGPTSFEVASPASQELYVFDSNGTHQFTMSLVTGDFKYNFSYRFVFPVAEKNKFHPVSLLFAECDALLWPQQRGGLDGSDGQQRKHASHPQRHQQTASAGGRPRQPGEDGHTRGRYC